MIGRLWRWFGRRWFMYTLHRLHDEPILLAACRACRGRARLGTTAYWRRWNERFEKGEFAVAAAWVRER